LLKNKIVSAHTI